ncbi:MAG TPA: glycoside hydrolase family 16 protein [Candidatus Saccharimonadales bacterium]|jgi:beta-glucanase (GH16 family)
MRLFPRIRTGSKSLRTYRQKIAVFLKAVAVTAILAVATFAMFVPFDVVRDTIVSKVSAIFSSSGGATMLLVPDDSVYSDTTVPKCTASAPSHTQDFATCPSFVLDYRQAANGSVSERFLNIFKGRSGTNEEQQIYTASPQNVRIENGSLVLEARNGAQPGAPYTSARIDTKTKQDFLYGRIVVRAKLPKATGTWPAIWMLPSQPKYAALISPTESSHLADGEIDIAEAIGRQPNVVYGVAHSLSYDSNGVDRTYFNTVKIPGNDTTFHNYEVQWTPTSLTYKVDGKTFFSYAKPAGADYRSWPYDQRFYLIINIAMGGTWAGQDRKNFPIDGIDRDALPASLRVESIQYYPYINQK